jgi:oligopeptide/dipeptide ABC transporter ATP-binding protein
MAIACKPRLLITDEPTTALDVTVQAQILALLRQIQAELGLTILVITHDFGVAAEMADEVAVLYGGYAVETGKAAEIFDRPLHPYTRGLLKSALSLEASADTPLYAIPGVPAFTHGEAGGCPFRVRCPAGTVRCDRMFPELRERVRGHAVRCFNGVTRG